MLREKICLYGEILLNFALRIFCVVSLLRKNVEVSYVEEKNLNLNSHRTIYYSITVWKFFSLHFQKLKQLEWNLDLFFY